MKKSQRKLYTIIGEFRETFHTTISIYAGRELEFRQPILVAQ